MRRPAYPWVIAIPILAAGLLAGGFFLGKSDSSTVAEALPIGPALQASGDNVATSLKSPLLDPTPPTPVTRLIMPWEPHQAMVIALTHRDDIDLCVELCRLASPYVEVLVLIPALEQSELLGRFFLRLGSLPDGAQIRTRLRVVPASVSSIWTRDYMPLYGLGKYGRLLLLDNRMVGLASDPVGTVRMLSSSTGTMEYYRKLEQTVGDDIAPAYLASFLRTQYAIPAAVVRPPIYLDGGDVVLMRPGELLLSESTLRYNGGQEDALRESLRVYYGIKQVHFLPTLPGLTIDHLDYIVSCIAERTLLVATPAPSTGTGQAYYDLVQDEAMGVLNRNAAYLKKAFPDFRQIAVPMPPVFTPPRADLLERIRGELVREIALRYDVDWQALNSVDPHDPNRIAAVETFTKRLNAEFGSVNLGNDEDLDRLSRHFLGESLADREKVTLDRTIVYRTYLNSVLIHAPDGRRAVIVPRYKPRNTVEETIFPKLESQVLAAYREAVPGADLLWMDCDDIIGSFGAVHCITHLVPDYETARKH